jgi:MSHA biogenesis protein MshM
MYLEHFGLKEWPFGITPDTSFFFSSRSSQQALNTLLVATRSGEGFIKITGEVGSGKTLLCRLLLLTVGDGFVTAYLPNPTLTPPGLLLELAAELGLGTSRLRTLPPARQTPQLLKKLNERLLHLAAQGDRVLLCLDEVQAMSVETLETLRLLTNLETEKRKLLQVVIFGQPELDEKLAHPSVRQLRQRITFDYRLEPLSGIELGRYLRHRLQVAGGGSARFTAPALWLLKWRSGGYPRLVNVAAHKALMAAFGRDTRTVGLREMWAAVTDTAALRWQMPRLTWTWLGMLAVGLMALGLMRVG